jgi:hypothetical protein
VFSRQLFLGEALDTDHVEVSYDAGVLTRGSSPVATTAPRHAGVALSPAPQGMTFSGDVSVGNDSEPI